MKPLRIIDTMFMSLPKETSRIFEWLSRGQFINSHSANKEQVSLYRVIELHVESLKSYFSHIDYQLEQGENYFYFSQKINKSTLEDRLVKLGRYLDALDFFRACDPQLGVGSRFLLEDWIQKVEEDILLRSKLREIEVRGEQRADRVKKLIDLMLKEHFFELEDELLKQYRVMPAFQYLLNIVDLVQLEEA